MSIILLGTKKAIDTVIKLEFLHFPTSSGTVVVVVVVVPVVVVGGAWVVVVPPLAAPQYVYK